MTFATKKKPTREIVAEPSPPPPSQAELDKAERDRMTHASLGFLDRLIVFGKRWLQVCGGGEHPDKALDLGIARWVPQASHWSMLQQTAPGERSQTLAEWLEQRRSYTSVWFAASLLEIPSDGSPRAPLAFLFSRIPVKLQDHRGSQGAFKMADKLKLSVLKKTLMSAPLPPTFWIDSASGVTAFWMLTTPLACDAAAPLLIKLGMVLGGEAGLSPRSFLLLPGQYCSGGVIPRREVLLESGSGKQYSIAEVREWLGEGTAPIRTQEEIYRDVAIRAHRA
jgi:hypothetical protein